MTDPHYCPCCGKPTTYRDSPEWLMGHFTGRYVHVLAALLDTRRAKRGLGTDELIEMAYKDVAKQDMPPNPKNSCLSMLTMNEPALNKLGWSIKGPKVTLNGYWLVPMIKD